MAKIFITGGAGFIGYFITKELLKKSHEVIIYDSFFNYISPSKSHYPFYLSKRLEDIENKVKIVRGDIRYRGYLVKALKETRPDIVIHLAAIPIASISDRYSEDTIQINLNGTVTVLESIAVVDSIKRFIYASSSFVYGDFQYVPADENHPTNPIDLYGGTKLSCEILTKIFSRKLGIDYVIIRPSAVYGPTDCNRRVTQIFAESALLKQPLILEDGGHGSLDFSYVEDVAHGFVLACFSPDAKNQIFNITRGEGRTILEYVQILKKLIPGIKTKITKATEIRPNRGTLDISKSRRLLGYNPKFSLEEGLKEYVKYVKSTNLFK